MIKCILILLLAMIAMTIIRAFIFYYISTNRGKCPKCGGKLIAGSTDYECDTTYYHCANCDFSTYD